jgi:hypothetical protein
MLLQKVNELNGFNGLNRVYQNPFNPLHPLIGYRSPRPQYRLLLALPQNRGEIDGRHQQRLLVFRLSHHLAARMKTLLPPQ